LTGLRADLIAKSWRSDDGTRFVAGLAGGAEMKFLGQSDDSGSQPMSWGGSQREANKLAR